MNCTHHGKFELSTSIESQHTSSVGLTSSTLVFSFLVVATTSTEQYLDNTKLGEHAALPQLCQQPLMNTALNDAILSPRENNKTARDRHADFVRAHFTAEGSLLPQCVLASLQGFRRSTWGIKTP